MNEAALRDAWSMLDDLRERGVESISSQSRSHRDADRSRHSERTRAAAKAAQRRGVKFGRKLKLTAQHITYARKLIRPRRGSAEGGQPTPAFPSSPPRAVRRECRAGWRERESLPSLRTAPRRVPSFCQRPSPPKPATRAHRHCPGSRRPRSPLDYHSTVATSKTMSTSLAQRPCARRTTPAGSRSRWRWFPQLHHSKFSSSARSDGLASVFRRSIVTPWK